MIGFNKQPIAKSVKRKKVVFNHFAPAYMADGVAELGVIGGDRTGLHTNKTLCGKKSENCDFGKNLLRQGIGARLVHGSGGFSITNLTAENIVRSFNVRLKMADNSAVYERYLFACNDGYVRVYNEQMKAFEMGVVAGENVNGTLLRSVEGEEQFLLIGDEKAYYVTADGTFVSLGSTPLTGMLCTCKNRLFVMLKDGKLAYSNPMTPWDISESIDGGGRIEFPFAWGNPISLIGTQEYVYVFFERLIVRILVKGSGRDFCMEEIPYDGGKIVSGSPCGYADGVIFLAEEGLWKIKGLTAERFLKELYLDVSRTSPMCVAVVYNEKYFLRYINADCVVVNLEVGLDGLGWTNCFDMPCLSDNLDGPTFVQNSRLYQLESDVLLSNVYARFESVDCDFGWRGKKVLRRLTLAGKGSLAVEVFYDGKMTRYNITFVDGKATIDVGVRAKQFSFAIEIKTKSYLRSMGVEIEA